MVIDPAACSFLADHLVGGAPLLPTVVQLDLVAGATRAVQRAAGPAGSDLCLSRIRVEDPVRFADPGPRSLTVVGGPGPQGHGWDVVLRGLDGATHLSACVGRLSDATAPTDDVFGVDLPGTADAVYPPMFHGLSFQVIARFGRLGAGLVVSRRPGCGPWRVPGYGGVLPSHLLELVLQACGVWELAETGRMMRPSRIAEVVVPAVSPDGDGDGDGDEEQDGVRAYVAPRPDGSADVRIFDGVVRDRAGRIRLQVHGYEPIALAAPVTTGPSTHEGAQ